MRPSLAGDDFRQRLPEDRGAGEVGRAGDDAERRAGCGHGDPYQIQRSVWSRRGVLLILTEIESGPDAPRVNWLIIGT